jgi:hypothetical protein
VRDVLPSGFSLARRAPGAALRSGRVTWNLGTLKPGASRKVTISVRISRNIAGRRCNTGLALAANAVRVRDIACTRIARIAPVIAPAVTG